jgi:hypothetical protein
MIVSEKSLGMPAAKPEEFRRRAVELARQRDKPMEERDTVLLQRDEGSMCKRCEKRVHNHH